MIFFLLKMLVLEICSFHFFISHSLGSIWIYPYGENNRFFLCPISRTVRYTFVDLPDVAALLLDRRVYILSPTQPPQSPSIPPPCLRQDPPPLTPFTIAPPRPSWWARSPGITCSTSKATLAPRRSSPMASSSRRDLSRLEDLGTSRITLMVASPTNPSTYPYTLLSARMSPCPSRLEESSVYSIWRGTRCYPEKHAPATTLPMPKGTAMVLSWRENSWSNRSISRTIAQDQLPGHCSTGAQDGGQGSHKRGGTTV